MRIRRPAILLLLAALSWPRLVSAQLPQTGREMYGAWCANCHAADGTGRVATRLVPTPAPDFTKCRRAAGESDVDWQLVITRGGSAAGLSYDMPAFESLTTGQAADLVSYLRTFCTESGWPSGNFNLPRALFTTKVFPDDEVAIQPMVSHSPNINPYGQLESAYAQRLGRRGHLEVVVPFETVNWVTGRQRGVGDIAIEGAYVLNPDPRWSALVAAGFKVTVPTGDKRWSFGEGTAVFQPFVAAATTWRGTYVQADLRGKFLQHRVESEEPIRLVVYNVSLSRDLAAVPTTWTVGVELNGLNGSLSVTPQIRKGLTRTGSLAAAFGVQLPVKLLYRQYSGTIRWTGYLLWDYLETARRRHTAVK